MTSSFDTLTTTAAWVASVALTPAAAAPQAQDAHALRDQLRSVRVELYCDHEQAALQALRQARRRLASHAVSGGADTMRALEEAAWHIRHHDSGRAHAALVQARDSLA
jgi:hypothetical protein